MVTLRVVHQIARMDLKKLSQKHPRGIGEVRTGAAFNLREIGLGNRLLQFLRDSANDFLLGHLPLQAAECSLYFPQVAKLFS